MKIVLGTANFNQKYGIIREPKWSDNYQKMLYEIRQSVSHIYLFVKIRWLNFCWICLSNYISNFTMVYILFAL